MIHLHTPTAVARRQWLVVSHGTGDWRLIFATTRKLSSLCALLFSANAGFHSRQVLALI